MGDPAGEAGVDQLRKRLPGIDRASVLEAEGVDVIHVDDDLPNAEKAGLPIKTPTHGNHWARRTPTSESGTERSGVTSS